MCREIRPLPSREHTPVAMATYDEIVRKNNALAARISSYTGGISSQFTN